MRDITGSIEGEWRRYKVLGEGALRQVRDDQLCYSAGGDNNSIAVIVRHLAGNLKSRFTDFLTADGEKPWRDRDSEFQSLGTVSRAEVLKEWDKGWAVLFETLEGLTDDDLSRLVTIRGEKFRVHEALLRLVAHTSYHVGQMVYIAKSLRGSAWEWLTIPPGKSQEYNQNPTHEKPPK